MDVPSMLTTRLMAMKDMSLMLHMKVLMYFLIHLLLLLPMPGRRENKDEDW